MSRAVYFCRIPIAGTRPANHRYIPINTLTGAIGGSDVWMEPSLQLVREQGTIYYGYPVPYHSVAALINNAGSGYIVRIERAQIVSATPEVSSQTSVLLALYRGDTVTAEGGTDLDAVALDTASPDLPSGLQVLTGARIQSPSSVLRKCATANATDLTQWADTSPAVMLAPHRGNVGKSNTLSQGCVYDSGLGDQRVQELVVRPGQEFAVILNNASAYSVCALNCLFSTGVDQYVVHALVAPAMPVDVSPIALINNSTIDVHIQRVEIQDMHDTSIPQWSLQFIDGIRFGEDVSVDKLDTASPDLPAGIRLVRNAVVLHPGGARGASVPTSPVPIRSVVGGGVVSLFGGGVLAAEKYNNASLLSDITLREGQGIALVQYDNSGVSNSELHLMFSVVSSRDAQGGIAYVS